MAIWFAYEIDGGSGPVFVGIGRRGNAPIVNNPGLLRFLDVRDGIELQQRFGEHPAEMLYRASKTTRAKSEVFNWLASLSAMPPYRTIGEGELKEVKLIRRRRRDELQRQGVKLLSGKLTTRILPEAKRVFDGSEVYKSVRAAASATGIPRSTISRWAIAGTNGWGFIQ